LRIAAHQSGSPGKLIAAPGCVFRAVQEFSISSGECQGFGSNSGIDPDYAFSDSLEGDAAGPPSRANPAVRSGLFCGF
jgi:hypothetical protein